MVGSDFFCPICLTPPQLTGQELTNLGQQLAEANALLVIAQHNVLGWQSDVSKITKECEQLKQHLLASEASRERMRAQLGEFVSVYISCDQCAITGVERKRFERAKQLLRKPASLALSEALKPVRENLSEIFGDGCLSVITKDRFLRHCDLAEQALTELNKLCPPPKADDIKCDDIQNPNR